MQNKSKKKKISLFFLATTASFMSHEVSRSKSENFNGTWRVAIINALRLLRVVWGYVIKIKWNIVFIVCDSLKIANVHHSVNFHLGKLLFFFIRHRTGDINMNSTLYCRLPLSSLCFIFFLLLVSLMCVTFGHCTHIASIHENYLLEIWFIGVSHVRSKKFKCVSR